MKVANINLISAAKSYNPNLLTSVPPISQVEEQRIIKIATNKEVSGKGAITFQVPSRKVKNAKRQTKLTKRKLKKVQKQKDRQQQMSQHEKLLHIIDTEAARRDGIFNTKTKAVIEDERKNIGQELASEVHENENKMDG